MPPVGSNRVDARARGEGSLCVGPAPPALPPRIVAMPSLALALTMVLDAWCAMALLVAQGVWTYVVVTAWLVLLVVLCGGFLRPNHRVLGALGRDIARKQLRHWPQTFALMRKGEMRKGEPWSLVAVDMDLVRLARIAAWARQAEPAGEVVLVGLNPTRSDFRPTRLDWRLERALAAFALIAASVAAAAMLSGSHWLAGVPAGVAAITLWVVVLRWIATIRRNARYRCAIVWRTSDGGEVVKEGWNRLDWTDGNTRRVEEIRAGDHLSLEYRVKEFDPSGDEFVTVLDSC